VAASPRRVITTPERLVDIDTAADYQAIRRRLAIGFLVKANKQVGTGHLRRVLTLAEGLQHHELGFVLDADTDLWATELIRERGWTLLTSDQSITDADVAVLDKLDTSHHDYQAGTPTVTLEDRGYGSRMAAAVINAMYDYEGLYHGVPYTGSKYAVLRSEFLIGDYPVNQDAQRVLILFGGTDPANLTGLAQHAIHTADIRIDYDIIAPGDDRSVAAAMHDADLLITSGGRTVFEAAAVGIPTIVMCQNMRETTHTHLGRGNLNLGLGRMVDPDRLTYVIGQTLEDYELRRDMSQEAKASIDGRGADRVRAIIEHVGYFGEKP
jgi:spore coat polysaccharide biosynthesis predicted glycosyltransferase SpsG